MRVYRESCIIVTSMITYGETDGERLCSFILHNLVAGAPWSEIQRNLQFTAKEAEWTGSFREMLAVNVTGRIVAAGDSLANDCGFDTPEFSRAFLDHLREMVAPASGSLNELFRFATRAVSRARQDISPGFARRLRNWAKAHHPHCYMCGTGLQFDLVTLSHLEYSAEHIWPRKYGGDSSEANLLPACVSCNSEKKKGFATWAMTGFPSVKFGLHPDPRDLDTLEGHYRFALHYRYAQKYANENRTSLKTAFLSIGPWTDVRLIDEADVGHFFNLENHR